MYLATSDIIRKIDKEAEQRFNISTIELMRRAGAAIGAAVRSLCPDGSRVLILAGKGNNGGDGYAAALELCEKYSVAVCDVFSAGQRSQAGRYYLNEYKNKNLTLIDAYPLFCNGTLAPALFEAINKAEVIVDAIFGTGFTGELTQELSSLGDAVNASGASVVAIDLPLGINADTATAARHSIFADVTVALTLPKPAHICYPAKKYVGVLRICDIGLSSFIPKMEIDYSFHATDESFARDTLPKRTETANKGSFGKTLHITGSKKYVGAAHLALGTALRSGVGIVAHVGNSEINSELRINYPEAIYEDIELIPENIGEIVTLSAKYNSVLVGCGSSVIYELSELITELIKVEGAPIILDADAINSIAKYSSSEIFKTTKRPIILTPHPLEFSRLSGLDTEYVNAHRIECAVEFAREYNVILLLKGAGTVITDGNACYINTTGSTALSKGGSGDVLAGLISSLISYSPDPLAAAALAAYIHGRAGDTLSAELSDYGVTPSDLPLELARVIKHISMLEE